MAQNFIWFALLAALAGIIYGIYLIFWILKKPQGTDEMKKIAKAIQEGAGAFLKRQYTTVAVVALIIFIILFFALNIQSALGFLIGAAGLGATGEQGAAGGAAVLASVGLIAGILVLAFSVLPMLRAKALTERSTSLLRAGLSLEF